jgi:hypothetical protein
MMARSIGAAPRHRGSRYFYTRTHATKEKAVHYWKEGDILIGKITPKGESEHPPEEKLLRAIFGEKAGDVRDASLTCPPGIDGTIRHRFINTVTSGRSASPAATR